MFFVFGSPRSGTTLLATSLDQSDHIAVPDESDFIIPLAFLVDRVKDPAQGRPLVADMIVATERFGHSIGRYLSADEVARCVGDAPYSVPGLLESIYAAVARAAGRTLAGDKSPNDVGYARMLIKNGLARSPIKVIHIVRDIRDVLLSLREAQPHDWPEIQGYFARFWSHSNLLVHDTYKGREDTYLFIQYEDLVGDPEAAFRRITAFLGVPFQDKMLDPAGRSERYGGRAHHRNLTQPIMQRRGNWRESMSAELQTRCVVQAREALERFNYPLA